MRKLIFAVLIFTLQAAPDTLSREIDPALEFLISNRRVNSLTLSQMKLELQAFDIEFFHPNFGKKKKYRGFKLGDVIDLGFGSKGESPGYQDAVFIALDGYQSVSDISKLHEPGGYIVFEDLEQEGWESVGGKKANPGPFYVVWTGAKQVPLNEYPWPWQLSKINLVSFEDSYPKVFPKGAGEESGAYNGYRVFKGRCLRCHSMNRQGGKVGPDLNAPKSIVSYRSEFMIKEFIRHPSKYRYSQMPDHPDLTGKDLDNLIDYFIYMNENRE